MTYDLESTYGPTVAWGWEAAVGSALGPFTATLTPSAQAGVAAMFFVAPPVVSADQSDFFAFL